MTDDPQTAERIRQARTLGEAAPPAPDHPFASLTAALAHYAADTARTLLVYHDDETGTRFALRYADFAARVAQLSQLLAQEYGITRGARVATLAYNHPDTVLIYVACWALGAVVAPQNTAEDDQRIGFILRNAGATLLLAMPEYIDRATQLAATVPELAHVVPIDAALRARTEAGDPAFVPATPPTLADDALLVYTSGTTGAPKGVLLDQGNLLMDALSIAAHHAIDETTRMMCVLPLHHVNGIVVTLITPLVTGASVVLCRAFKASLFWRRIAAERVAIVSVVPTLLQFLVEADEDISGHDLSAFRYSICGAGTLSVALAERFHARFGLRVLHGYGLSETTCYSCFLPVDLSIQEYTRWISALGYPSIGVPISANEMDIHDAEGRRQMPGMRGEIVVRGPNVMRGYSGRPDANAEAFRYGWFRTGDEGFYQRDERYGNFFFITGRLKELINRGGVKYSPFEIEEVLLGVPGVRVGLAIGFENVYYGEEVGAYIVRQPGALVTIEQILAACRARMPYAKCPKVVVFGEAIPVTTTGKYQRLQVQSQFAQWINTQFRDVP